MENLEGHRYGTLTVTGETHVRKGRLYYKCICDCGQVSWKRQDIVKNSKYCPHRRFIDIKGQKFGMLTALEPLKLDETRNMKWRCICDCGKEHITSSYSLRKGKIKSCGCSTGRFQGDASRLPNNMATLNKKYSMYKRHAVKDDKEFEITKEYFLSIIEKDCAYCGEKSYPYNTDGENINGVDRLDNSAGYVIGNVVPCCSRCNISKNIMNVDEFCRWIDKVYGYMHKEVKNNKV